MQKGPEGGLAVCWVAVKSSERARAIRTPEAPNFGQGLCSPTEYARIILGKAWIPIAAVEPKAKIVFQN